MYVYVYIHTYIYIHIYIYIYRYVVVPAPALWKHTFFPCFPCSSGANSIHNPHCLGPHSTLHTIAWGSPLVLFCNVYCGSKAIGGLVSPELGSPFGLLVFSCNVPEEAWPQRKQNNVQPRALNIFDVLQKYNWKCFMLCLGRRAPQVEGLRPRRGLATEMPKT